MSIIRTKEQSSHWKFVTGMFLYLFIRTNNRHSSHPRQPLPHSWYKSYNHNQQKARNSLYTEANHLTSLIYFEAFELPVRLSEVARVAADKTFACTRTVILFSIECLVTTELSAEIDVGNYTLIFEVRGYIAVSIGKVSQCSPPCWWVWSAARVRNVVGNRIAWEEPSSDSGIP